MNCIDRDTIQEYIDHELDEIKAEQVRIHLSECETCRDLYVSAIDDKKKVISLLSQLQDQEEAIAIPEFNLHTQNRIILKRLRSSALLKIAAGIAVIIGLSWLIYFYTRPAQPAVSEADLLALELLRDIEPNKAWHDNQMVFIITNDKGEVIQSFLSGENDN